MQHEQSRGTAENKTTIAPAKVRAIPSSNCVTIDFPTQWMQWEQETRPMGLERFRPESASPILHSGSGRSGRVLGSQRVDQEEACQKPIAFDWPQCFLQYFRQ